ncbi:DNA/RNA nuclease SfsA [bacterium]|nr:DNA/RNA nuclease SfsA [bacterium]
MNFPALIPGVLLRRYKRFLADVRLDSGEELTALVRNTGSLTGCSEPGSRIWLRQSTQKNPRYALIWTLVEAGKGLVCVDTGLPNQLVIDYVRNGGMAELAGFREYLAEVPYGASSRADLCCRVHPDHMLRRCWVEVKATTMAQGRVALFPDAVTLRGRRHLQELQSVLADEDEACQIFLVQRSDVERFRPADHIDPAYGAELRRAAAAGVKLVALRTKVSTSGISIDRELPVEL